MQRSTMKAKRRRHQHFHQAKTKDAKMNATESRATLHAGGHTMRADTMA